MQRRELGKTGLQVSRIGVGLAALGRPGYINIGHSDDLDRDYDVAAMESRAHAVLDAAHRLGVNYFDAARSYGRAEAFLKSWFRLRGISRDSIVVGSKWGYTYTAGWQVDAELHEVKEHSLDRLRQQWRESRNELGEHLRLYQIHSATFESGVLTNTDVLNELVGMKEKGVIVGLTSSGPRQGEVVEAALSLRVDGERVFDCLQATWNLLERSAGGFLATAHAEGMGVIVKEVLANGRLTNRNTKGLKTVVSPLIEEAGRLGSSVDALAIAAALAQPWVDVVLSGAARVEHVQSNLQAVSVTFDEQADRSLLQLAEPPEQYWKKRSCLAWN